MNKDILYFIIAFIAAMLWYRILFLIAPIYFKRPFTRSMLKLRWHHLHYGILATFAGVVLLLFSFKNTAVVILLGVGSGLIMDLFIPSLLLKTDREEELTVYKKTFFSTAIIFIGIVGLLLALVFLI